MSVLRKVIILLCVYISFSLADTQMPLSDEHNSTNVQSGRQLGVISFLQKLLPTQDPKTYPTLSFNQRCPLCDSSVYSYCGERLLHDACCCSNPPLPYQCKLADCSFLHANSCREHRLIANCCCSDEYRSLLKTLKH